MLTSFRVVTTLRLILQKYNHLAIVQITIIWNQSPQLAPLYWISVTQWPKPIYKLTKSVLGSQPHFCKSQRTHNHAQYLLCLWLVWDHTRYKLLSFSQEFMAAVTTSSSDPYPTIFTLLSPQACLFSLFNYTNPM